MSEIGCVDVTGGTATSPLKSYACKCQPHEGVQSLNCHCGQGGFAGCFWLQVGGNAANATEATSAVAGQFYGRNLRLAGTSDANANYLSATVDVDADWFVNFGADGCCALGKFDRGKTIARESLVVKLF